MFRFDDSPTLAHRCENEPINSRVSLRFKKKYTKAFFFVSVCVFSKAFRFVCFVLLIHPVSFKFKSGRHLIILNL